MTVKEENFDIPTLVNNASIAANYQNGSMIIWRLVCDPPFLFFFFGALIMLLMNRLLKTTIVSTLPYRAQ